MNPQPNMIEQLNALLPRELFEGSKDWVAGDLVERVEWLLSQYESQKSLAETLQDQLETAIQYNFDRT